MDIFRQVTHFISYLFRAKSLHGVHSTFVFNLYSSILEKPTVDFSDIELVRNKYTKDSREIEISDLGAGTKSGKNKFRKISNIVRYSSKNKIYYELLAKLIQSQKYTKIIELGTSLGICTSYFSKTSKEVQIHTFEGCKHTLEIAEETFINLKIENVATELGNIDTTLPDYLNSIDSFDLVYIDANHRYEPTIRYFELLKSKAKPHSCIVFDDIYWSAEMTKAWQKIKADPTISISLDFFELGIVFFRKEIAKQDFILQY